MEIQRLATSPGFVDAQWSGTWQNMLSNVKGELLHLASPTWEGSTAPGRSQVRETTPSTSRNVAVAHTLGYSGDYQL